MKDYQTSIITIIIWIGFRQGAHEYELQYKIIQNTSMQFLCQFVHTVEIALDPFLVYINSFPLD